MADHGDSKFSRREFVVAGSAGTLLWSVGCGGTTKGGAGLCDPILPEQLAPTCGERTASNIEGPFYEPNSPERAQLFDQGVTGTRLTLRGRVLGTDCTPISGAALDFWHADDAGAYDDVAFRGHQFADEEGNYTLQTIVPGRYLNGSRFRPSHIHVKVSAPGFGLLTTQLYFPCDPYADRDPHIKASLIMAYDDRDEHHLGAFDFVIAAS